MKFEVWGLDSLSKDQDSYYRIWVSQKSNVHLEDSTSFKESWVVEESREWLYNSEELPGYLRVWIEENHSLEQCLIFLKELELKTQGIIWLPTAKFRPGSEVKGFVLHRDLTANNKVQLSQKTLTLILVDSQGQERRAIEIQAATWVSLFQCKISEHDPIGTWKLLLKQDEQQIFVTEFDVIRFEKPEIEIVPQVPHWFLKDSPSTTLVKMRYFFGEPVEQVKQAKLTVYQQQDSGEKQVYQESVQHHLQLLQGDYELNFKVSQSGFYEWELAIEDSQSRTGWVQGTYRVVDAPFQCSIQAASDVSPYKPDIPIPVKIELKNPVGSPLAGIPIQLEMEGDANCWEFLEPPNLVTNSQGQVLILVRFKNIDDPEEFKLSAAAIIAEVRQTATTSLRVMPRMSQELWLDVGFHQAEYQPGEQVRVQIELKGKADIVEKITRGSAALMGEVVMRSLNFTLSSGRGILEFTLPKKIKMPLNFKVSVLKEFPEFIEREIPLPVRLPKKDSHALKMEPQSTFWSATTAGMKEVATGEPIQVTVNFPQPLVQDAKVMAWLIDRRISRGTKQEMIVEQLTRPVQPVALQRFPSISLEDWFKVKENSWITSVELGGVAWVSVSYMDEHHQGKLILIRSENSSEDSPETAENWLQKLVRSAEEKLRLKSQDAAEFNELKEREFLLKTLLCRAYSSQEIEQALKSLPLLVEFQVYTITYYLNLSLETQWVKSPQKPTQIQQEIHKKVDELFDHLRVLRGPGLFGGRGRFEAFRSPLAGGSEIPRMPMAAAPGNFLQKKEIDRSLLENVESKRGFLEDFLLRLGRQDDLKDAPNTAAEISLETASTLILRQDFIEVEFIDPIDVGKGSNYAIVEFAGSDAITEYDVVIFIISAANFGMASHQVMVRNPLFTTIKNPPEMVWGDQSTLCTLVQNLSHQAFNEVILKLQTEKIRAFLLEQVITTLLPKQSVAVNWAIKAVEVGNAQVLLSLETQNFREVSQLDTPLRVQPPGEPEIQRYTGELSPQKPLEWTFELTGNEIFTLGILSLMPNAQAAIIEGVECLANYPYGCCEQTYASTLPNFILYQYLERHRKLTPTLSEKLRQNLVAGQERYLTIFRNPDSGGFGLWSGEKTSIFHTALALSILGLMSQIVAVAPMILESAVNYLLNSQKPSGSWQPQRSLETPFPSTLSEAGNTSFIFHGASLAQVPLPTTLNWLKSHLNCYEEDAACLALVLDALTRMEGYRHTEAAFMLQLKNILLKTQKLDGSWSGQSSLSGWVETTSYCMMALGHAFPEDMTVRQTLKKALDYLLENRRSTGWYSTRDTLYASWAIGEVGHLAWTGEDVTGTAEIYLNGHPIKVLDFSQGTGTLQLDLLYQARRIYLEPFLGGKNQITCKATAGFNAHVLMELQIYRSPEDAAAASAIPIPQFQEEKPIGKIALSWSQREIMMGEFTDLSVQFTPHQTLEALLIEIPIPAGTSFNLSQDLMAVPPEFDHLEINQNKVALFASHLQEPVVIKARFHAELPGEVQVNPIRIYPMYNPEAMMLSAASKLKLI